MKKAIIALAVLSATSMSAMAVEVKVSGTITPAACTPSIPGSAEVNYGTISPTLLSATAYTLLDEQELEISLLCDAPAKMGFSVQNGRLGSMAGVTAEGVGGAGRVPVSMFGSTSTDGAGLGTGGTGGTQKIGGYGIRLMGVTTDTNPADVISKGSAETTWVKNASGSLYEAAKIRQTSWAKPGEVLPVAFTEMKGTLKVQAYINKKSELDTATEVKLDGSTTISLVYL